MKTVTCKIMDAVKYYRGNDLDYRIDAIHFNGGFFPGANNPEAYDFVCNLVQYNGLVSQLSNNFGKSLPSDLYLWHKGIKRQPETNEQFKNKLNEMDKELEKMESSEIDWSKAPHWATECATYAIVGVLGRYKYWLGSNGFLIVGDESVSMSIYGATSRDSDNDIVTNHKKSDFHVLATRPIQQPVFTQAMADNGELPQVGMECMYFDKNKEVTVLVKYLSSWVIVFEQISEGYGMAVELAKHIDDVKTLFKPIDQRTDKEKACDAIWKELDDTDAPYDLRTAMELAYDKWVGE